MCRPENEFILSDGNRRLDPVSPELSDTVVQTAVLFIVELLEIRDFFNELKRNAGGDYPPKGTVLVFLPGIGEIMQFLEALNTYKPSICKDQLHVVPLHSSLGE